MRGLALLFFVSGVCFAEERALPGKAKKTAGDGEPRIALIIGNGAYKEAPLANPVNDARDMAKALSSLGFNVTLRENVKQKLMKQAIRDFGNELKKGGVGLFYFAGHGVQVKGRNYLIPVGTDIQGEDEVEDQSVDVNLVMEKMESAENRINIVVLDACRNNPFARSFRSASRGLAQVDAAKGSYIAYATAPGSVAADGSGRNGIYTKHLLASLKHPESDIEKVFKRVRAGVVQDTNNKQIPWESSSLVGDFYFNPGVTPVPSSPEQASAPQTTDPLAAEITFWETIQNSVNASDFHAYLRKYPNGTYAELAKNRLQQLGDKTKPGRPAQLALAAPGSAPLAASAAAAALRSLSGHVGPVKTVAISPDGRYAVSGGMDDRIMVWNLANHNLLNTIRGDGGIFSIVSWFYSVAFTPDGKTALTGGSDSKVRQWNLSTGEKINDFNHSWAGGIIGVKAVAISPDGRDALSGAEDGTIKLWSITRGIQSQLIFGHKGSVTALAFSPDGKTALSASDDKTLKLWQMPGLREVRSFAGHGDAVTSVAFSPDGRYALSGSADKTLRLWDVTSGGLVQTFSGHADKVNAVVFTADGRYVLSGSADKTLKLWEAASGQELRVFAGHAGAVNSVALSPDGRHALSASDDKTLKLWEIAEKKASEAPAAAPAPASSREAAPAPAPETEAASAPTNPPTK